jgi:hypothetical protein
MVSVNSSQEGVWVEKVNCAHFDCDGQTMSNEMMHLGQREESGGGEVRKGY